MLPNAPVEHPDVDIIHKDTGPAMHHPYPQPSLMIDCFVKSVCVLGECLYTYTTETRVMGIH